MLNAAKPTFRLPPWHGKQRRSTLLALGLLAGGVVPPCIPGWPYGLVFWCLGSWLRSPQWNQRVAGRVLAGECWNAQLIAGPFHRWDGRGCN